MFVAFGVLMPALMFCARYLRAGGVLRSKTPGAWFRAHRAIAVLTVLTALAGGLTTGMLYQYSKKSTYNLYSQHAQLGMAALVLMVWQPINAIIRPDPLPRTLKRILWTVSRIHFFLLASYQRFNAPTSTHLRSRLCTVYPLAPVSPLPLRLS